MIEISTKQRISQKPQRLNKITITSMNLLKLNYLDFSKKIIKAQLNKSRMNGSIIKVPPIKILNKRINDLKGDKS